MFSACRMYAKSAGLPLAYGITAAPVSQQMLRSSNTVTSRPIIVPLCTDVSDLCLSARRYNFETYALLILPNIILAFQYFQRENEIDTIFYHIFSKIDYQLSEVHSVFTGAGTQTNIHGNRRGRILEIAADVRAGHESGARREVDREYRHEHCDRGHRRRWVRHKVRCQQ